MGRLRQEEGQRLRPAWATEQVPGQAGLGKRRQKPTKENDFKCGDWCHRKIFLFQSGAARRQENKMDL